MTPTPPDANLGLIPKLFTVLRDGYRFGDFKADAIAGLTVAIVALPLAMALGIASGASPDKGLVTAVVAGVMISALGGSRVQIGGPTGAFVVVVFNVIAQHGYDGLVLATLVAGAILIVAGYAKLGQLIRFIPYPVVAGFTAGIAVIIASSQVRDFLGLAMTDIPADFIPKWISYAHAFSTIDPAACAIGVLALAIIIVLRRYVPKAPGYLIAIVMAVAISHLFTLRIDTIGTRFPDMPTGLPAPAFPAFSFEKLRAILPSSFTIAFLAGIEALLSAVVADGMTGFRHRSNQELVGQGVANVASALFAGLPATGAIARTATNIRAGGRTPVAGIMHALFLLVFILFAGDLMKLVPMSALAAILFVVAWGMSEYERFLHLVRMPSDDRGVLLLTFALTVLVDLTVAIAVGVVLASILFMNRMSKAQAIADPRGQMPDGAFEEYDQRADLPPGVEVFRMMGPLFFGVASQLLDTLRRMGQRPAVLILRLREVPFLDTTGASALRDFALECKSLGIRLVLSGTQPQPMSLLMSVDLGPETPLAVHARDYGAALDIATALRGAPAAPTESPVSHS
ncbi:MAG: STAS domain-containing protein [Rhodospirillaceae bacterium]|nr:STAS domain-containing protein [Rhodospirillaceae bacterium]